jgi:deoxyribose-phosphate aldolase
MIDPRELTPIQIKQATGQLRGGQLMRFVDNTLLAPQATSDEIDRLVEDAVRLRTHLCINPVHLPRALEKLESNRHRMEKKALLATVVGFPLGATTTKTKVAETGEVLELGADEVDMVANHGLLKSGETETYTADIDAVAAAIAAFNGKSGGHRLLKVIIECCLLTDGEKEFAAAAIKEVGRKRGLDVFVKTSTGFAKPPIDRVSGATIPDVLLLRRTVGDYCPKENRVGVKAAGGIRDATAAVRMLIAAGAFDYDLKLRRETYHSVRLGTSRAAAVARDFEDVYSGW